jgi:nitroreductase
MPETKDTTMTMNDSTIKLLLTRRSVQAKDLVEPGPSTEHLDIILRAGLRVPDHGRVEPWRIQVLRKPAQRELGELCARIFRRDNPQASDVQLRAESDRVQQAPLLIIVSSHPDPRRFAKVPAIEQLLSAGALCQNLLIAAQALGYGAQWVTGWPAYHPEIKAALGHDPTVDLVGFVYLGTVAAPPAERPRPELESIVSEWQGS